MNSRGRGMDFSPFCWPPKRVNQNLWNFFWESKRTCGSRIPMVVFFWTSFFGTFLGRGALALQGKVELIRSVNKAPVGYGCVDLDFNSFVSFLSALCGSRSNEPKLESVCCKTDKKKHLFSARIVKIRNSLKINVVTAFRVHSFRQLLILMPYLQLFVVMGLLGI